MIIVGPITQKIITEFPYFCIIALNNSLFIKERLLPQVFFFSSGACSSRLLTHSYIYEIPYIIIPIASQR